MTASENLRTCLFYCAVVVFSIISWVIIFMLVKPGIIRKTHGFGHDR